MPLQIVLVTYKIHEIICRTVEIFDARIINILLKAWGFAMVSSYSLFGTVCSSTCLKTFFLSQNEVH
jgi:hypothetical protein